MHFFPAIAHYPSLKLMFFMILAILKSIRRSTANPLKLITAILYSLKTAKALFVEIGSIQSIIFIYWSQETVILSWTLAYSVSGDSQILVIVAPSSATIKYSSPSSVVASI